MTLDIAERVIAEAHARLDAAKVPSCHGACCTDPTCHTRLGHRIKLLVAERDALRMVVRAVASLLAADRMAVPLPLQTEVDRLLEEPPQ